jgi:hypothetical protein
MFFEALLETGLQTIIPCFAALGTHVLKLLIATTQRRLVATLCLSLGLGLGTGCTNEPAAPAPGAANTAETTSPADSPMKYTVLADNFDAKSNSVDFHVLVGENPKHDDVEKLLKYLYRHLMQRKEPEPTSLSASVYSNEAQYKTPPRTPIATLQRKSGELVPAFENKTPLEFWQQIEVGLFGDQENDPDKERARQARILANGKAKLPIKIDRNDAQKSVSITFPYTEGGKDEWAEALGFNQAMNYFTDIAQNLFEKVPELSTLTYIGQWSSCKDHAATCPAEDVVKITLDRETYRALKLGELDEQIGQIHGRAYLEMSTGRGSDAAISKANSARMAGLYKKMLAQMKGRAWVSPKLK